MSGIKRVAVLNACLVLILVGLGGFVRGTGAGLSCPDWPLCFGRVVPHTFADGVAQEYAHRVLAGLISVLTICLAVLCFRRRNSYPRLPRVGIFLVLLLVVQAIMGGLTVLLMLNPFIVTGHLILGTAFLQTTALMALERDRPRRSPVPPTKLFMSCLGLLVALLVFQISLGGFVGSSGASLACPDFPLCLGEFPPASGTGPQWTVFAHGMVGFGILVLSVICFLITLMSRGAERARRGHVGGMLFLVLLQVLLGIGNIHMAIPVSLAVVHLIVAQVILLGIASLYKDLRGDRFFFQGNAVDLEDCSASKPAKWSHAA